MTVLKTCALVGLSLAVLLASCAKKNTASPLAAKRATSVVKGTVVDKAGNKLSGVLVTVDADGSSGQTSVSGPDGNFTITAIEAGTYTVRFHFADYRDTATGTITLGYNDTAYINTKKQMKMTYRYGVLKGTVTDSAGAPAPNSGVAIDQLGLTTQAITGNYTISRVEPGDYTIYASNSNLGCGSTATKIHVAAEDTAKNTGISLTEQGGGVSGTLLDASGKPMAGAVVTAMGGLLATTVDAKGNFFLGNIPSGGQFVLVILKSNGDTARLAVAGIQGEKVLKLDSVRVGAVAAATNNMTVIAPAIMVDPTQDSIMLTASVAVSAGTVVDHYDWDINGVSGVDTSTAVGYLKIPTGAVGTRTVTVVAVSVAGKSSAAISLKVVVIAPPKITQFR